MATRATLAPRSLTVIRCLIVDDHPAIRVGLRELLSVEADLEVVAACASAENALAFAEDAVSDDGAPVHVAIVDHQLGGHSGLWLSRRLRALPDPPRVLVYSAFSDHLLAAAAVVAEASAVVSKGALPGELADTIRALAGGERRLPSVPPSLAESIGRRLDPVGQAIFGLMAAGVPPREAAATLRLAERELDTRLWTMLRALERPRRAAA
ncbi:MAG TPA: response regulator [Solirubrobacteraceae bacterium]|nr:response regulator [Solirubrobacteraceae bacterium]